MICMCMCMCMCVRVRACVLVCIVCERVTNSHSPLQVNSSCYLHLYNVAVNILWDTQMFGIIFYFYFWFHLYFSFLL